jgi:hypothetical protein
MALPQNGNILFVVFVHRSGLGLGAADTFGNLAPIEIPPASSNNRATTLNIPASTA